MRIDTWEWEVVGGDAGCQVLSPKLNGKRVIDLLITTGHDMGHYLWRVFAQERQFELLGYEAQDIVYLRALALLYAAGPEVLGYGKDTAELLMRTSRENQGPDDERADASSCLQKHLSLVGLIP